ncbi:phytoene synthase [Bradyrhizobium ottawaense]|uniref:Squalene/phytoene synthase family protein n=1 Tax=Bradyrhizobium ottawaense TaxID=931866 RepID=A0A2U8PEP8_9BRAD|nr:MULTISPECIES: phytoene/squalene synthase family protein [Bradyrhizobium]AWL95984.1 squalene/phytoene synthase family protein [Bradyrhizobium ottawaense]MBR1328984.1 squalene/phytoene synthase family protein [Bradyrhizobium ottawaense]MBR1334792.1 squalene/phytoene synthase family protein [Bradyrhizobium ottawaense]
MSSAAPPPDSVTFCADLVRSHDFPRYVATLFAPAAERRALLALYAFNVEIVRVRDQVSQPLPGEIRFQWWTDMLSGHVHGSAEGNPVAAELLRAIRDFDLPVEPLSLLVDEHQFDLYNDPMPTMAALEGYLAATSSALFALAAQILAPPSDATVHLARHAGLAQGIVQVIANLPRDAAHRQLFLPQQLLASLGCNMEDVFAGKETPNLRSVLEQLAGEARQHLATALSLLPEVPAAARAAFLPIGQVRADLKLLSQPGRNPFTPRPSSRLRTLWTLWRASRSREFTK